MTKFEATVEDGVGAIRNWQRGDNAFRSRWARTYLTERGMAILDEIGREMPESQIRAIVTRAVATGY